jgi:uncharacterized protein YndB with AHSA1/START domain
MKQEPFVIERTFNAPVERVWKAITDKDQMKQWYFDIAAFRAEPGFEFEFSGIGVDCEQYRHLCKVIEAVPNKKLSYSWTYDGYEGYSVLTFELFEEGDKTRLKLTHEGLETFPQNNPSFARSSFAAGWTELIGSLLPSYVETATITKTISFNANKTRVWDMLTDHEQVKRWANAFSEGTYVETDWQKGSDVIWKDKEGNVGAKGSVETIMHASQLKVVFTDDSVNSSDPLHTYFETYKLAEKDGHTEMIAEAGPLRKKHIEMMESMWDNAIRIMKEVVES